MSTFPIVTISLWIEFIINTGLLTARSVTGRHQHLLRLFIDADAGERRPELQQSTLDQRQRRVNRRRRHRRRVRNHPSRRRRNPLLPAETRKAGAVPLKGNSAMFGRDGFLSGWK